MDANVAALAELLAGETAGPVVVVGHSFGCAVALKLAAARPDLVAALVLLDPGGRPRRRVDGATSPTT